jgi:succinyl-CoA synthetase beta subunit
VSNGLALILKDILSKEKVTEVFVNFTGGNSFSFILV